MDTYFATPPELSTLPSPLDAATGRGGPPSNGPKMQESLSPLILAHLTVAPDELEILRRPPGHMLVRVVCGQFRPAPGQPAVSAPMLSATPGALLAAEIVKAALHGPGPLSPSANMVETDIVSGPHHWWCTRRGKQPDSTEASIVASGRR
jgi:hypothetical protein